MLTPPFRIDVNAKTQVGVPGVELAIAGGSAFLTLPDVVSLCRVLLDAHEEAASLWRGRLVGEDDAGKAKG